MTKYENILFSSFLIFSTLSYNIAADEDRKAYIVYMGSLPKGQYSASDHHHSLLQEVVDSSYLSSYITRSYKRSFNGFVAMLTSQESQKLAEMKGVVSVFPSRNYRVQTTRSWSFLGLPTNSAPTDPAIESDVVIGVIDSGIWPESESFSDEGFGPPPKRWKGVCEGGTNFTCNKKVIGARHYRTVLNIESTRDSEGHGTHTASIAAGNKVKDVSFHGLAKGTARGGVSSARIAAYRVCLNDACADQDILSAFDDAIADGVDIITISIGSGAPTEFVFDVIAIGAFHAMEKGILTTNSAGNAGPEAGTVSAVAPWLLSVAASTIDRKIIDKVVLGNGRTLIGSAINPYTLNGTKFPLVYGSNVSKLCSVVASQNCESDCVDQNLVKGKIVVCDKAAGSYAASSAGAVGSISRARRFDNVPSVVPLPASSLVPDDYNALKSYLSSSASPEAEILKSEEIKDSSAPAVASFSSHGPNIIAPDILKPDVTAPGVDILAAYIPQVSNGKHLKHNILSGTSMSCPHAAGVAAYVKSLHPDWSSSAIQSAIMTTASPVKDPDAEFAYGSGQINPVKAINPGLVYEALKNDYVNFLCSVGYDTEAVKAMSGSSCPTGKQKISPKDFNYPSLIARVVPDASFSLTFRRTVTNVGNSNSTYKAKIFPNSKLSIKVVPQLLSFKKLNEKKSFSVTVVSRQRLPAGVRLSASLVWSDGIHSVKSPIVVHTK